MRPSGRAGLALVGVAMVSAAIASAPSAAWADGDTPSEPRPAAADTPGAAAPIRVEPNLADPALFDVEGKAPAAALLSAIREATGIALMHGALPDRPVEVRVAAVLPIDAIRAVAIAADLVVERSGDVVLVRRPRPLDRLRIDRRDDGSYAIPDRFAYGLHALLGGDPESRKARRALTLLEHNPELSLVVAPDLAQLLAAELNREAPAYRRVLDRADAGGIAIPRTIDPDRVRMYVAKGHSQYLGEILFAAGDTLVHLVYVVEAKERKIRKLIVFESPIRK